MLLIQQSISQSVEPDLVDSLLLDARERVVTLRLREAMLSIGTACEIAANIYLRRKGKDADGQVKKLLGQRVSFAEKRFHLVTDLLDRRSLKREDPIVFDLVEKAYQARNSVAHEGRVVYKDEDSMIEIEVDAAIATRFLDAAGIAKGWLAAL